MEINPLKHFEKEYALLILQYLHLNPNGRTLEQIYSSIEHNASPSTVKSRIDILLDLNLIYKIQGKVEFEVLYALTERGRCASEVVWDLFRIILNPHDSKKDNGGLIDFYR
ncbi:MAG: hypothetical protein ACFFAE_02140 [Candidatus Hodarchaeota archaeon]